MCSQETWTAPGATPGGWRERFVFAGGLVALVAGAGGCSMILGYDDVDFDDAGTTGSQPGMNPDCVPSEASGTVDDTCGAFVWPAKGDDVAGDGTKARPFRTLARALAASNVVYACNDGTFDEAVEIDGDAAIFGGLDCTHGWAHTPAKRTQWRGVEDRVTLHVDELARVQLRDIALGAPDAKRPGGSSIVILAGAMSTVDVRHCAIAAGQGADAAPPPLPAAPGMPGAPGAQGGDGCSDAVATDPGMGGQNVCDGRDLSGGAGGPGLSGSAGADGSDGSPAPAGNDAGRGGKKQDASYCGSGFGGAKGDAGANGTCAKGIGTLTADGFAGADGTDGNPGEPGHGGGGGGGARQCANGKPGPAGGGGGAGGCGGAGKGGRAGGASIGIVSLNATLAIDDIVIAAGKGGRGADGAPGGPGGQGGLAGSAGGGDIIAKACSGGKGGDGGKGGRGGGGGGGPSIGIAYRGAPPPVEGVEITVGAPGEGGKGDVTAGEAAPGLKAKTQEMP